MNFNSVKFKTFLKILLVVNVIAIVGGFFIIRANKLRQQDVKYLKEMDKFAGGMAEKGGLSKQEIQTGMLLEQHTRRDRSVSDQDLDKLIALIERGFASDKSGISLVDFGGSFDRHLSASPRQKSKIGRLCIKIARGATRQDCRVYALRIISLMKIESVRNDIPEFLNDSNPNMVKLAGIIIKKLDGVGGKAG